MSRIASLVCAACVAATTATATTAGTARIAIAQGPERAQSPTERQPSAAARPIRILLLLPLAVWFAASAPAVARHGGRAHHSFTGDPGLEGAVNWPPPSYSPRTGLFYVHTQEDYAQVFYKLKAEHLPAATMRAAARARCSGRNPTEP